MRLDVVQVLVTPNGRERVARELLLEERPGRRDREGVAVEEEKQVAGIGLGGDRLGERVQLLRVAEDAVLERLRRGEVGDVVELRPVLGLVDPLEVGVDEVGLRQVALEVAQLDVDPARVAPVDRGDANHAARLTASACSL